MILVNWAGKVLQVADQQALDAVLGLPGAAAAAVLGPHYPPPHVTGHLHGQLHDMEQVNHQLGGWQHPAHRALIDRAHVNGHDLDAVPPRRAGWASQYAASSAVRPSTWPRRPWSPDRSKKHVCHRSASSTYSPVPSSIRQRARRRRCSSIPRCATSDGGCANAGSARAANAACTTGQDRPHSRAACATVRPPSATRPAACSRSRPVTRQRGGTAAAASVNVLRGQDGSRHSSRRLTCTTLTWPWPQPRSAGRVVTYPFTCADTVPQSGHAAASGTAGLTRTVRLPPLQHPPQRPPRRPARTAATPYPDARARGSLVITIPWKEP